jgi:uncharacterized protein (TIGR02594 family)
MLISSLVSDTKVMKMGSSGSDVGALQLALKNIGYALTGTGYFGTATDTAVTSFQKRMGLTPDGDVGPTTAKAIDNAQGKALPAATAEEVGRPLWLEAGLKFVGTREGAGGSDSKVIMDWAKDEGGSIAETYTHDSIPWCALFANMMLTKAGLKGTESLWALDFAGKWPAIKLNGPAVGAFAPMLRNGGGHIICVVGRDQNGNIMGLGGNQSDKVSIVPFPMSRFKKANGDWDKGFWWPVSIPTPVKVGITHLPVVRSDGKVSSKES